jgi:hypothetical protein
LRTIGQERDPALALAREPRTPPPAEGDLVLLDDVAVGHEGIS